jgi:hypothetical protein
MVRQRATARSSELLRSKPAAFAAPILRAVQNYLDGRLTGPVSYGVLVIVNCFIQNPSAEMRGGFLR